mmetsp:Transcript_57324/g.149375  ORF Transcript_57324/g.149375 Transcript_57324/m.149375 type:complete len:314 (-) Transcript_57324:105-1046(-)
MTASSGPCTLPMLSTHAARSSRALLPLLLMPSCLWRRCLRRMAWPFLQAWRRPSSTPHLHCRHRQAFAAASRHHPWVSGRRPSKSRSVSRRALTVVVHSQCQFASQHFATMRRMWITRGKRTSHRLCKVHRLITCSSNSDAESRRHRPFPRISRAQCKRRSHICCHPRCRSPRLRPPSRRRPSRHRPWSPRLPWRALASASPHRPPPLNLSALPPSRCARRQRHRRSVPSRCRRRALQATCSARASRAHSCTPRGARAEWHASTVISATRARSSAARRRSAPFRRRRGRVASRPRHGRCQEILTQRVQAVVLC